MKEGIDSLPNPDPSQISPLSDAVQRFNANPLDVELERNRAASKNKTQRWAGLHQNPYANLFVFVGRWSKQKGIDLIADAFASVLSNNPSVQLICVGPIVDLYGKFASAKLQQIVQRFPGCVCFKPEFTILPPYIYAGADFVLLPSRDEPYGLVAVQFGRKGALGIGARVGGLGNMPGWWYTVESTTTEHLLTQFKEAVDMALSSSHDVRMRMRANALRESFPITEWRQSLYQLHADAIVRAQSVLRGRQTGPKSRLDAKSINYRRRLSLVIRTAVARTIKRLVFSLGSKAAEYYLAIRDRPIGNHHHIYGPEKVLRTHGNYRLDGSDTESFKFGNNPTHRSFSASLSHKRANSLVPALSKKAVLEDRTDFHLQNVDPPFMDSTEEFYAQFRDVLVASTELNLDLEPCIQDYLVHSEREWFERLRNAKLGFSFSDNDSWLSSIRKPRMNGYVEKEVFAVKHKVDVEKAEFEVRVNNTVDSKTSSLTR